MLEIRPGMDPQVRRPMKLQADKRGRCNCATDSRKFPCESFTDGSFPEVSLCGGSQSLQLRRTYLSYLRLQSCGNVRRHVRFGDEEYSTRPDLENRDAPPSHTQGPLDTGLDWWLGGWEFPARNGHSEWKQAVHYLAGSEAQAQMEQHGFGSVQARRLSSREM